jgi:hypothetical protein
VWDLQVCITALFVGSHTKGTAEGNEDAWLRPCLPWRVTPPAFAKQPCWSHRGTLLGAQLHYRCCRDVDVATTNMVLPVANQPAISEELLEPLRCHGMSHTALQLCWSREV